MIVLCLLRIAGIMIHDWWCTKGKGKVNRCHLLTVWSQRQFFPSLILGFLRTIQIGRGLCLWTLGLKVLPAVPFKGCYEERRLMHLVPAPAVRLMKAYHWFLNPKSSYERIMMAPTCRFTNPIFTFIIQILGFQEFFFSSS